MKDGRLKILIIAHELSPYSGSECAVGWNLVTRIAAYHDITVLHAGGSQTNPYSYQHALKKYFADNPAVPGLELVSIDQPRFTRLSALINRPFSKIGSVGLPALYYLGYRAWQKKAYSEALSLHKRLKYDAVHQITQITYREPGYTWKLGIPFFWGPTGGVANMPWDYYKRLSLGSKIIEGIRFFSNKYQTCCMKRIRKAISHAEVIYTFSNEDARFFTTGSPDRVRLMLDVGTTIAKHIGHNNDRQNEVLEGVWCGQLTYRKAPEIVLNALAAGIHTREKIRLTVIGSGPLESDLIKLAARLKLNNIRWIRDIPHQQVFEIMQEADFLVHTSLREATSSVIPEALSVGLPVICHDANGMGIAINETCGIKIPLLSPEKSVLGFHEAMNSLILQPLLLARLKKGALKRAEELSWDNMAKTISNDYSMVVKGDSRELPDE